MEIFGLPMQVILGQVTVGMVNGAFYALLSLGLAVVFGLLGIINFVHGALYMLGAFVAWFLLRDFGIGYWGALVLAPLIVGLGGIILERLLLRRLYRDDPLYGMLCTFGVALVLQGTFVNYFGSTGLPYAMPSEFAGAIDFGFLRLPKYRGWVVLLSLFVCVTTWLVIERTKLGSSLRAATENPVLVESFGVNVPRLITLTYAAGAALAALAGVMAAPIYQVSPLMGADLIIVVFAVVAIGGMGSILGSMVAGFGLGVIEGLTKVVYPQASSTVIFILMVVVLILRPAGLFGRGERD